MHWRHAVLEPTLLQFRGEGPEECEKFVAAVINQAFAQGMLGDDRWVADFAATCLAQDALRWWSSLDQKIQTSWRLLRQEMLLAYPQRFHGRNSEEAEKFVHMVFRRARESERQQDNNWIIRYVPTCLAGDALRWYSSLDPEVQGNWRLLQQAIWIQWPEKAPQASSPG